MSRQVTHSSAARRPIRGRACAGAVWLAVVLTAGPFIPQAFAQADPMPRPAPKDRDGAPTAKLHETVEPEVTVFAVVYLPVLVVARATSYLLPACSLSLSYHTTGYQHSYSSPTNAQTAWNQSFSIVIITYSHPPKAALYPVWIFTGIAGQLFRFFHWNPGTPNWLSHSADEPFPR